MCDFVSCGDPVNKMKNYIFIEDLYSIKNDRPNITLADMLYQIVMERSFDYEAILKIQEEDDDI
jgi:hypothetical protein